MQWWIPNIDRRDVICRARLQWGHHFAVVDTGPCACPAHRGGGSFNGATTLQWWIQLVAIAMHQQTPGFNGATTLQWWIRDGDLLRAEIGRLSFNGATTLQWWILKLRAEVTARAEEASMGPPLCSGGYHGEGPAFHQPKFELQWGHHFAVVDTPRSLVLGDDLLRASMGPPLCSGGYETGFRRCREVLTVASMGPPLCSGGYESVRATTCPP